MTPAGDANPKPATRRALPLAALLASPVPWPEDPPRTFYDDPDLSYSVRAAMVAHPEAEWVDSDAVFTDMDFSLPLDTKKSWLGINAGVFLIRNFHFNPALKNRAISGLQKAHNCVAF
ncbi:hypothetical protein HU200_063735 [Digitaria exilis]|uniref:Uncharacterized protein n=1 Tax=Digitaria exilis TaxID=1010633 RepID=A0A835A360_9POAL|nr:hypothetical protein HU200_063735 [Digitaria exilis]